MPALIAALAIVGLAADWPQRAVIASLAVPASQQEPSCAGCGQPASPPPPWPRLRRPEPCPGCGRRPSPPALAAGLATALLLAAAAYRVHPWPVLAATAWLIVLAVPLSVIDLKVHRLPNVVTGSAYTGVVVFLAIAAADADNWAQFGRTALGGVILVACFLLLALLSKSQIGIGDCKAAAVTGTLLAWYGWNQLLTGTLAAFLLGSAYGVWLIARHAATRRSQLPFVIFSLPKPVGHVHDER
jgi:leader peptidase (prepilin peptidase) / N-methyltransferase